MMVRDLAAAAERPRLRDLILLVVPIYNADGNERVSKDNRPGQVGPEEGMGRRENAAGLDLNRDFMKLDAPETRALVDALNRWDPHLVIDCHTTNGSHHRYALTYDGPKNPAGDPRVVAFARERMFPDVGLLFEKATKRKAYFYGNFERNHTLWTSFPATPRFGTTYIGLATGSRSSRRRTRTPPTSSASATPGIIAWPVSTSSPGGRTRSAACSTRPGPRRRRPGPASRRRSAARREPSPTRSWPSASSRRGKGAGTSPRPSRRITRSTWSRTSGRPRASRGRSSISSRRNSGRRWRPSSGTGSWSGRRPRRRTATWKCTGSTPSADRAGSRRATGR